MNYQVDYLKREKNRLEQRIEALEAELASQKCGNCKKMCGAGVINKKPCDPK